MLLDFYQIIVHDLKSWEKPAPKLHPKKEAKAIEKPTEGVKQQINNEKILLILLLSANDCIGETNNY